MVWTSVASVEIAAAAEVSTDSIASVSVVTGDITS
jgi:hypothetical protein